MLLALGIGESYWAVSYKFSKLWFLIAALIARHLPGSTSLPHTDAMVLWGPSEHAGLAVSWEKRSTEGPVMVVHAGEQYSHINRFPLKLANRNVYVRIAVWKPRQQKSKCAYENMWYTQYMSQCLPSLQNMHPPTVLHSRHSGTSPIGICYMKQKSIKISHYCTDHETHSTRYHTHPRRLLIAVCCKQVQDNCMGFVYFSDCCVCSVSI